MSEYPKIFKIIQKFQKRKLPTPAKKTYEHLTALLTSEFDIIISHLNKCKMWEKLR